MTQKGRYVTEAGKIIVKFKDDTTKKEAKEILKEHKLSLGREIGDTRAHFVEVPKGKEVHYCGILNKLNAVDYAEPSLVRTLKSPSRKKKK